MKPTREHILFALEDRAKYGGAQWEEVRKFLSIALFLPDWMTRNDAWIVTHKGLSHIVHAQTGENAANHLRFDLYGNIPFASLPQFAVELAPWCDPNETASRTRTGTLLGRAEIARRLARMAS